MDPVDPDPQHCYQGLRKSLTGQKGQLYVRYYCRELRMNAEKNRAVFTKEEQKAAKQRANRIA